MSYLQSYLDFFYKYMTNININININVFYKYMISFPFHNGIQSSLSDHLDHPLHRCQLIKQQKHL